MKTEKILEEKEDDLQIKNSLIIQEEEAGEEVIERKKKKRLFIILGIISLILILIGGFIFWKMIDNKVKINEIIYVPQPLSQNNKIRTFTLENELKVILINPSDPKHKIPKTTIALTVGVGSQLDPDDYNGLTHLIEHLLFTGSDKFKGNYMDTVINKYNGESNGETNEFSTSYYFNIDDEGFGVLMTVLADALKNPVYDEETVKKEIHNVNSEIGMRMIYNRDMDYYQFLKSIGNNHCKMFNDGFELFENDVNIENLTKELEAFQKEYYSSNLMTLVVISNKNKTELKTIIESEFGSIVNSNISRPFFEQKIPTKSPFNYNHLGSFFFLENTIDISDLTLIFILDSNLELTSFKPEQFLERFLSYKSENSFSSKLFDMDLINNIDYELIFEDNKKSVYAINFEIKDNNDKNVKKVLFEFFAFVEYLKNFPKIEKIYENMQEFSKFDFVFNVDSEDFIIQKNEFERMDMAKRFSEIILENTPQYIFADNNILYDFDSKEWDKFLDDLNIENCLILYQSKKFQIKDPLIKSTENDKVSLEKISKEEEINEKITLKSNEEESTKISKDQSKEELTKISKDQSKEKKTKVSKDQSKEEKTKVSKDQSKEEKTKKGLKNKEKLIKKKNLKFKIKKLRRILEEENNEDEEIEVFNYIDKLRDLEIKTSEVILTKTTSFNNHLYYEKKKFSDKFVNKFNKKIPKKNKYEIMEDFHLEPLETYNMLDTCKVINFPKKRRRILTEKKSSKKKEVKKNEINYDFFLDSKELLKYVFLFEELDETQKKVLKELKNYKKCLTNEFESDNHNLVVKSLKKTENFNIFYKLLRQSYQPKYIVYIEIEQEHFVNTIYSGKYEEKLKLQIEVRILCNYLKRFLKSKFPNDFLQGNKFNCFLTETLTYFIINFESLSNSKKGMEISILKQIKEFQDYNKFKKKYLQSHKEILKNYYSDFDNLNSLELANYYLSTQIDKSFVKKDKINMEKIIKIISEVTSENLADLVKIIFKYSNLNIITIGRLSEKSSIELSESLKTNFEYVENKEIITNRKLLYSKLFNKPEIGTSVYRIKNPIPEDKNNVYISYFFLGTLTIYNEVVLKVIKHYFNLFIYKVLRTNLNLGYVAEVEILNFYYNHGIILELQGENFEPHTVEKIIDKTILDFLDDLYKKSDIELVNLAKQVVDETLNVGGNLDDLAYLIFLDYDQYTMFKTDNSTYKQTMKIFKPASVKSFAKKIFLNKKIHRRVIIEISENLDKKAKNFVLDKDLTLTGKEYVIRDLIEDSDK